MHSWEGDRLISALLACHFSGRMGKGEASSMSCNTDQSHWRERNIKLNEIITLDTDDTEKIEKTLTDQTGKSPFHTEEKRIPLLRGQTDHAGEKPIPH